jgi:HSP20 family protein
MDIHENNDANIITATFEFPGLKKDDISIDVHNSRLNISAESKISSDRDESGYVVRERRYGKWSRSLPLPKGIKASISFNHFMS